MSGVAPRTGRMVGLGLGTDACVALQCLGFIRAAMSFCPTMQSGRGHILALLLIGAFVE